MFMKYRRYGKFNVSDYLLSWVAVGIWLCCAIMIKIFDFHWLYLCLSCVYGIATLWCIFSPHRESFFINKDCIVSTIGNKKREIKLPAEIIIVVSPADICPPFATRTAISKSTHILKGKYAVTLLSQITMEDVINSLHDPWIGEYTTSMMEPIFEPHFLYSFVCNRDLLEKVIAGRKYSIIVPSALLDIIDFEGSVAIHVD